MGLISPYRMRVQVRNRSGMYLDVSRIRGRQSRSGIWHWDRFGRCRGGVAIRSISWVHIRGIDIQ